MPCLLYGAKKKPFSLKNQVIYNKETALVIKFLFYALFIADNDAASLEL